jgi:hypothetical protein
MITVDNYAPTLLSAIQQLLDKSPWALYCVLIYEILTEGTSQAEYAGQLRHFLPRNPAIAQLHNTFAEITNSQALEDAEFPGYVAIPYAVVVEDQIPQWVQEGFEQLQARFVTNLPQSEPQPQAFNELSITMDTISQDLQDIDLTTYGGGATMDSITQDLSNFHTTPHQAEDLQMVIWEPDLELDVPGLTPADFDPPEIEPSVRQARAEALEYLVKLDTIGVETRKGMDGVLRAMAGVGLE